MTLRAGDLGPAGDDVYEALVAAHDGLSPEASARLYPRLVLLLANELGDPDRIREVVAAARAGLDP